MINFILQNLIKKTYAAPPGYWLDQSGVIYNPVIDPKYGTGDDGARIIGSILSNVFMAMIIVGAIILIVMIIWSGISILTSGDSKEKLQAAQKRLTNSIIGFVILICVFAIASFVGNFFGLTWLKTFNLPFPTAGTN